MLQSSTMHGMRQYLVPLHSPDSVQGPLHVAEVLMLAPPAFACKRVLKNALRHTQIPCSQCETMHAPLQHPRNTPQESQLPHSESGELGESGRPLASIACDQTEPPAEPLDMLPPLEACTMSGPPMHCSCCWLACRCGPPTSEAVLQPFPCAGFGRSRVLPKSRPAEHAMSTLGRRRPVRLRRAHCDRRLPSGSVSSST